MKPVVLALLERRIALQSLGVGLVVRANLRLGERLFQVLDAHESAAEGLLRGVRPSGARDDTTEELHIAGQSERELYANPDFAQGARALAGRGLTYDTWHYHHQNSAFAELARSAPDQSYCGETGVDSGR